jgi:hypothetical protein
MYEDSVFEQLALWNPHDTRRKDALPPGRERGAVYTRQETVDFILNLAGYLPARPHKPSIASLTLCFFDECNRVTFDLYGLNAEERAALSRSAALPLSPRAGIKAGEYSDLPEMMCIETYFAGFMERVAVETTRW